MKIYGVMFAELMPGIEARDLGIKVSHKEGLRYHDYLLFDCVQRFPLGGELLEKVAFYKDLLSVEHQVEPSQIIVLFINTDMNYRMNRNLFVAHQLILK